MEQSSQQSCISKLPMMRDISKQELIIYGYSTGGEEIKQFIVYIVYIDSDYAGDLDDRKSTSGYILFLYLYIGELFLGHQRNNCHTKKKTCRYEAIKARFVCKVQRSIFGMYCTDLNRIAMMFTRGC